MLENPRILAFAGSLRAGSFNKRLVKIAAEGAREAGAEVTLIDLRDFPMPLFDQDLEDSDGLPESAKKLKALFRSHHGLLIASPEYNSSFSGVLKNSIDWISRVENAQEPPLVAFTGKTCALFSASPGWRGGLRGLVHLRDVLGNIGVTLLPEEVSIPAADELFDDEEDLKDHRTRKRVTGLARKLVEITRKLN